MPVKLPPALPLGGNVVGITPVASLLKLTAPSAPGPPDPRNEVSDGIRQYADRSRGDQSGPC